VWQVLRKTVSHYKILKKLGEGGMGEVYKAEDTRLGRNVVLKFLPEKFSKDRLALERFAREARSAGALDHPSICTIYDVGEYEGQPFIVMQYLEGKTLREALKKAPFDIDQILNIGIQIAAGLEKAHDLDIIHRDIKPANIILTKDGRAKILDFGLAKLSAEQQSSPEDHMTSPGSAVGTTLYMSPEQVRGDHLSTRSDLFSLGVILYQMATGRLPYAGTTAGAVFDEILNKTPMSPVRINPDLPDELERIISKCMEKEEDLRYQSTRELLADLKRFSRDSGRPLTSTSGGPLPPRPTTRRPWWFGPGVALGVLILATALAWYFGAFSSAPVSTSVGVVPFTNSSGDTTQEALADGLTEDIVANLSRISGLSVYRFKDIEVSPRDKAGEFGVGTILEGTIRRVNDKIRISTNLTEASSGRILWSRNYDRELTDIFALQTEIALQVAAALEVELLPEEESVVGVNPTSSVEAYDLYLQGRFLRHTQENPQGLRQAAAYFQQAIELDSNYSLAYAGLAECYFMLASIYGVEPWEAFGEAAEAAVRLGDSLPEPHVAMGLWQDFREDDAIAAEAEFTKALEIDPRHANARREYARFLMRRGRFDEALSEIDKVHDPMFAVTVHLTRSEIYRYRGQYDEAMREAHKFRQIWSGSDEPLLQIVSCYIALTEYGKAEEWAEKISATHPAKYRLLALLYMLQDRMSEAREASSQLTSLQPDLPFTWWIAGSIALWEKDYRQASESFEIAYELPTREDLTWWRPHATYLGVALWRSRLRGEAAQLFAQRIRLNQLAMDNGNQHPDLRRDMAVIHATLGDREEALQWMGRAVASGYAQYDLIMKDRLLESLYTNSRFQQMISEMEARVGQMRLRVEAMESEWSQ
jgi:serine/threonine protein kinase/tetratricopeptide (TPR) repeat protein